MREGQFIKQNITRWKSYETPADNADELAKRFTYLVDDLAYAKTFYPGSKTVKYINGLAANIYLLIYRTRKENTFIKFWTTELPLIVRKYHRILLFTFLFFILFVSIGVFSAKYDQTFIRAILGDGYVDMTEQNIAKNDPFGVYKGESELSMFVRIAVNNIGVAFYCFAMGIFASVGTLYVLFRNGLMLGAFEYLFFSHDLGFRSILVVFIHGTLEISAIVIAGCAGIIMGNSILFPKTYTRLQSLTKAARDAVKIIVGLVPVFIIAAFFEGFVTRHTEMPVWLSMSILLLSLAFVVGYFVIYPIQVSKRIVNGKS
jgi:uncharacterized membrane protein SpoIIM required for sporulation